LGFGRQGQNVSELGLRLPLRLSRGFSYRLRVALTPVVKESDYHCEYEERESPDNKDSQMTFAVASDQSPGVTLQQRGSQRRRQVRSVGGRQRRTSLEAMLLGSRGSSAGSPTASGRVYSSAWRAKSNACFGQSLPVLR